ncbi:NAD-dependent epimerase/dehydratase family protein [Evansella cellulosilytica]|uniref:dTDP-glucose 4,6-dehydratase n=1 Tax=Evansella cellulosilytica (strain ATCC 21833 / DSM 2522 / FERM P-1141 / JCM 9156 / N-4) TaxID=649639 RepID=E6TX48_EVAC2|nr:NAD-dependent epimerase/dehydratase family protein [Evansella cellulosilytica]ADU31137.1 dTDP-glucose 4,6-dehydratase [Evansella cellulosilytica DSM 2522]
MKNILVTGGLSFIGSYFIKMIAEKHPHTFITNADRKKSDYNGTEKKLNSLKKYRFIETDLDDKYSVNNLFDINYDAIIYFEDLKDDCTLVPSISKQESDLSVVHLLEQLRKGKAKRMVYVSSSEVIGSHRKPFVSYMGKENTTDLYIRSFFRTYGAPIISVKSCCSFGEDQRHSEFIPNVITKAVNNLTIPIYGNEGLIREWVYVKDQCEAIYLALMKGRIGKTYYIHTSEPKKDIEVVKNILARMKRQESLMKCSFPVFTQKRIHKEEDLISVRELGWKMTHTFGAALEKTVQWYLNELIKETKRK